MFEQIEEREVVVDHEANVGDECEEAIGAVVTIKVESEGGKVVALRLLLLGHVINRNNYSFISISLHRPAAHYSTSHRRELAAALTLTRTRIGRSRDSNRGKPWSHHCFSSQGQHILYFFLDPQFDSSELREKLVGLVELHRDEFGSCLDSLALDLLGIVKGLSFHKKFDLAISVFEWFKKREDCDLVLNGSVVAVIISILWKVGRVSNATSLFQNLHNEGFSLDVYAYTSLVTACASNGRYREAVSVFKKMEEEGCRPTLITYNVILNVYGKMGMPWHKIRALVEGMKSSGIALDSYTYNTLITCCRCGSLYLEAAEVFQEMKTAGFVPEKVTYNALLDVYGKSRRTKEAMEVLKDMESNGFSPSIVSYNSLILAYARDGLLEEATALKTQMVDKGIKPDVFTYTTLLSGYEKAGKDDLAMRIFEEIKSLFGCKPNICTFNALIKMHGNRGNFAEMMKVFEEIKILHTAGAVLSTKLWLCIREAGVTPDLSSYNAVLAALARGGLWQQSEKMFAEMLNGHCKPNELTYSYANGKEIERIHILAEEIYSGVIEPHVVLLKTLVLVFSKSDLLMETEHAFLELRKKGFSPDITILNAML
ncbi:unnamed protein product [Malus baccata var. baccata]